jgi:hypothetical protein
MRDAPDRPGGFPAWAVVALVAVVTAGAGWWILHGGGGSGATPVATVTHEPCQPVSGGATPSPGATAVQTADWSITVTSALVESSVPAQDGGRYPAALREVFITVAVTFTNLHPGTEAPVSTSLVRLECADGTQLKMVGFDQGKGFCRICGLDLGTSDRRVRWTFLFRMKRANLDQPFRFVYDTTPAIDLTLDRGQTA